MAYAAVLAGKYICLYTSKLDKYVFILLWCPYTSIDWSIIGM